MNIFSHCKNLCIFSLMKTNQVFVVCNDFVHAKHGFHYLKLDLVLKFLLIYSYN